MTTWIERLVQLTNTKSKSPGRSPKTKLEQPPADGPHSRPHPCLLARLSEFCRPRQLDALAPWSACRA